MRILLDEDTPIGVRRILAGHDVRRATQMGWAGLSNSDLLDAAENAGFEAFVTCDQNIMFQQNLAGRKIAVVVLSTNRWAAIRAQPQRGTECRRQCLARERFCRLVRPSTQISAHARSQVLN